MNIPLKKASWGCVKRPPARSLAANAAKEYYFQSRVFNDLAKQNR